MKDYVNVEFNFREKSVTIDCKTYSIEQLENKVSKSKIEIMVLITMYKVFNVKRVINQLKHKLWK